VAALTILFDIGMPLNNGAGHDQRLDIRSPGGAHPAEGIECKGSEPKHS